jgi:hypothetical protein
MDNKPWFKLDPNNYKDRWWLYSSIVNTQTHKLEKKDKDIICQFIIQDKNNDGIDFWRCSTWYKDDPNRYLHTIYENDWKFDRPLQNMKEGDITVQNNNIFKVYNCSFSHPDQVDFSKIFERIN